MNIIEIAVLILVMVMGPLIGVVLALWRRIRDCEKSIEIIKHHINEEVVHWGVDSKKLLYDNGHSIVNIVNEALRNGRIQS